MCLSVSFSPSSEEPGIGGRMQVTGAGVPMGDQYGKSYVPDSPIILLSAAFLVGDSSSPSIPL